jgi:biopolymer transport protein ExbD
MAGGGSSERVAGEDPEVVEQGAFVDINITPLVDIFLVLLVILMASSTTMVDPGQGAGSGFKVQLPSGAASAEVQPGGEDLIVAIPDDGTIIVRGEYVSLTQLRALFAEVAAKDTQRMVLVQADAEARHKRVVEVMEAAREAGLSNLAIATQKP